MRFALIWSEVSQGLRRNLSMVVSVVLVTFISLTFVGAAALLQLQITQMKTFWYDKAQVAIYMCNGTVGSEACAAGAATPEQVAAVEAQLDSPTLAPLIDRYYYESQDDAYANFQEQFAGNAVVDYVTPDLLNEAYWVNLKDPSQADVLQESLSALAGVDSVTDQRRLLDQIFSVLNVASITAIGIASIMLVAAGLLISTTIRLSAYSRRRELGIMRLVGASNRFIQTPFILEGAFASLLGALLAGGVVVAIVQFFVQGYLATTQLGFSYVTMSDALLVVPLLILVGVLLAAVSAQISIRRHLRV
ncbi:permease-like cell division protein FtsX [Herbiconiux sp. L3-i23]|uniref:permease-like cell division protein FtsX n=1 Tax=Herbiconiux sp. L3-i23 TaxID=2905871 RepID=UPI002054E81B|nr:permease-like cell division protein FtsX [Herbiconiux sp. L3-i23]BDI23344.1 cell division protein FtsX [Herbiconiux sp. L3-i23]